MKKLTALLMSAAMLICVSACSGGNSQSGDMPQSNKVDVVMGYSLDQLGLKLSADSNLSGQQMKYNDLVDVNGNYTEVYQSTGFKDSLMVLQGFDKQAMEQGEVYLNGRTFSKEELSGSLVYETSEIAVYDISYYVLSGSLEERMENSGVKDLVAAESLQNIGSQIIVKNPVQPAPQKPQRAQESAEQITL